MTTKDTSLPAFPATEAHGLNNGLPGMTLRQWYAGLAMQAAATNAKGADGFTFRERAAWAFMQADAMIAEGEQVMTAEAERLARELELDGSGQDWSDVSALLRQQAAEIERLTTALSKCRDAMPTPVHGDKDEHYWTSAIAYPLEVPGFVKFAADKQAAEIQRLTSIVRDFHSDINELTDMKNAEIERLKVEVQAKSDVLAGSLKAQGQKDALLRDIGEWMNIGQGSSSEELMLHLRERMMPVQVARRSHAKFQSTQPKHSQQAVACRNQTTLGGCMSQALERVIAEQQSTIDHLKQQFESGHKTLNTMWTKHSELFEAFARLIDADLPDGSDYAKLEAYRKLRYECRLQMLETGYCMTCYNFVCECEGQYD